MTAKKIPTFQSEVLGLHVFRAVHLVVICLPAKSRYADLNLNLSS